MTKPKTKWMHAHVYFNLEQIPQAEAFRHKIIEHVRGQKMHPMIYQISPLIHEPIGPHPLPMFEADFESVYYSDVKDFFENHRQGLSVLIHQLSGDEFWDHTEGAEFLGKPVELKMSLFKKV